MIRVSSRVISSLRAQAVIPETWPCSTGGMEPFPDRYTPHAPSPPQCRLGSATAGVGGRIEAGWEKVGEGKRGREISSVVTYVESRRNT